MEVLRMIWKFVRQRLQERQTYVGIAALAGAAGIGVTAEQVDQISTIGLGVVGLLNILVPDGQKKLE